MEKLKTQTAEEGSRKLLRILSLDGGGAKGFYSIGVLDEIEKLTKQPIYQSFNLIFGTSTGAILAALLARGDSVSAIRELYEKHVVVIMKQSGIKRRTKALHELARSVFKNEKYDVFKTGVGIVATNWNDERPIIFKASANQAHGSKGSFEPFFGVSVADAIIGSCSAYPFFSSHKVTKNNGDIIELADGGFCANNPTLYAIADATKALKHPADDLRVISIGVGSYPTPPLWKRVGILCQNWDILLHVLKSKLLKEISGVEFLQKILGTNTNSMEILKNILFKNIPSIRISDSFVEPEMATDLLEHDLSKLNRLVQKGRLSFAAHEEKLKQFLEVQ
jgi:patatin-like phospholipase/acyl hydrolase